jgi:Ribonuclease G/E
MIGRPRSVRGSVTIRGYRSQLRTDRIRINIPVTSSRGTAEMRRRKRRTSMTAKTTGRRPARKLKRSRNNMTSS